MENKTIKLFQPFLQLNYPHLLIGLEPTTSSFTREVSTMTGGPQLEKRIEGVEPAVQKRKEILCDGWFYDVTDFVKRHPGGGIINYYVKSGEDATLAIQQFHHRSSAKVQAILKSFKKRPAEDSEVFSDPEKAKRHKALTEDFTKLYLELDKEGMFKPSYSRTIYRMIEPFVFMYAGFYLLGFENLAIRFLGCVLAALAGGRAGWIQHEASHMSLTGKPNLDRFLNSAYYGFFHGLCAGFWRRYHNRHHAMPQRLQHDADLETMPILAFTSKIVKDPKQGKSFFVQNQRYLFLLVDTFIVALVFQLYLHPRYMIQRRQFRHAFSMFLHYYIFAYNCGFWPYLIVVWLESIYLFGHFSLSHTHLPVTNEPTHWVEYGLTHTADVEQKPWCNWWMGYLNYQIEHHLFPQIPQSNHPKISGRVKALAEKHGIPYHVFSYKDAWRITLENMDDVARELKGL